MKNLGEGIHRREFLQKSVQLAGLTTAFGAVAAPDNQAGEVERREGSTGSGRSAQAKVPGYRQVARFEVGGSPVRRIAIDASNRVYVACGSAVRVLDATGAAVSQMDLSSATRCVAVAGDGTIYVGLRDHIEVFDQKASRVATWDSPGAKTWLTGLAVGTNDLFAADSANRGILHYDRSGKLLGRIGGKDRDREIPGLIVPSPYLDVKIAPDGLLRVNNPGRHRVEAYTFSGELEFSWGKAGGGIQNFCGCCNPVSVATLADGRHVTCEKGLPRVKLYSARGDFEYVVAGQDVFPANARGSLSRDPSDGSMSGLDAAVDAHGRIYVLDLVVGDVRVMEPSV